MRISIETPYKARHFASQGMHQEAFAQVETALRLDPRSWDANKQAGLLHFRGGRFEDAIHHYRKAVDIVETDFSSPMMLVTCYLALGDTASAQQAARTTRARAEQAVAEDKSNGTAMAVGCIMLSARAWVRRAWAARRAP